MFIYDLIRKFEEKTASTLAYADDITLVCNNLIQVDNSIEIIEKWSEENKIYLNKTKNVILVIRKSNDAVINLNKIACQLIIMFKIMKLIMQIIH